MSGNTVQLDTSFENLLLRDFERERAEEWFEVTMKDLTPVTDVRKRGYPESLKVVKERRLLKTNKKVGRKATRSQGTQTEFENDGGLVKDSVPSLGDGTSLQAEHVKQALSHKREGASNLAQADGSPPTSEIILDNWIECVKCGQWRLCVPGVNPIDLQENWQCRDMTWLPGLNSCRYTEQATIAALYNYCGLKSPYKKSPKFW